MPRIYTSANDPLDFCWKCFPKNEDDARDRYGNLGDGPDGRGNCFDYDASHPDYDGLGYVCYDCQRPLKEISDGYLYPG